MCQLKPNLEELLLLLDSRDSLARHFAVCRLAPQAVQIDPAITTGWNRLARALMWEDRDKEAVEAEPVAATAQSHGHSHSHGHGHSHSHGHGHSH